MAALRAYRAPMFNKSVGTHLQSQYYKGMVKQNARPTDQEISDSAVRVKPHGRNITSPTQKGSPSNGLPMAPTNYYRCAALFDAQSVDVELTRVERGATFKERYVGNYYPGTSFRTTDLPGTGLGIVDRSVYDGVINKTLIKLKDQKVNLGTALAESKSTLQMVGSTASSVIQALRQAKRGNFVKAAKNLGLNRGDKKKFNSKDVSGRWLELQYGWLPLLSDIHGGIEQLKKGFRDENQILSVHASEKCSVPYRWIMDVPPSWEVSMPDSQYRSHCKIWYRIPPGNLHKLNSLGLLNPLEIAWELVPYSFVLDWMLPVGDFLQAVGATTGLEFVAGFHGHSLIFNGQITFSFVGDDRFISNDKDVPKVFGQVSAYQRRRLNGFPLPRLNYVKNPLSSIKRVANAISLINQRRR